MIDSLVDAPWWLVVCLIVIGTFIALMGNNRLSKPLRDAGLAVVVLALLLSIFKFTIPTPSKKADNDTRALIEAATHGDWQKFQSLLAPQCSLSVVNGQPIYVDAAQLTKAAQAGTQRIGLKDAHVTDLNVMRNGPVVRAELNLLVEDEIPGAPLLPTSWRFEFEHTPRGWAIVRIICLKIGDMSMSDIQREMPTAR